MARINIEDTLFKEKRFEKLILKLGSRRAAIGALIEAFMLAQKHYLTTVNDRLIPLNDWELEEIGNEIIDCGFAEIREKGVYVKGSDKQFSWLLQRSEAGKRSAQIKAQKRSTTVNDRSTTVDGSQPLSLSLTHKEHREYIRDLPSAESPADEALVDCNNRITPQGLFEMWNDLAHPSLPRAIKLTAKRRTQINARIKEYPEAEFWQDAITMINSSKFCLGQINITGSRTKSWTADFDWFIKPDSAIKLIEGKYSK